MREPIHIHCCAKDFDPPMGYTQVRFEVICCADVMHGVYAFDAERQDKTKESREYRKVDACVSDVAGGFAGLVVGLRGLKIAIYVVALGIHGEWVIRGGRHAVVQVTKL